MVSFYIKFFRSSVFLIADGAEQGDERLVTCRSSSTWPHRNFSPCRRFVTTPSAKKRV